MHEGANLPQMPANGTSCQELPKGQRNLLPPEILSKLPNLAQGKTLEKDKNTIESTSVSEVLPLNQYELQNIPDYINRPTNPVQVPKEHREEPLENPTDRQDRQDPAEIHARNTSEDTNDIDDPFEPASPNLLITTEKID